MSNVVGFLLCLGFAWFAVDAFANGHPLAACVLVAALIGTLLELLREGREG